AMPTSSTNHQGIWGSLRSVNSADVAVVVIRPPLRSTNGLLRCADSSRRSSHYRLRSCLKGWFGTGYPHPKGTRCGYPTKSLQGFLFGGGAGDAQRAPGRQHHHQKEAMRGPEWPPRPPPRSFSDSSEYVGMGFWAAQPPPNPSLPYTL